MKNFNVTLIFEFEENGQEKQQEFSFIIVSEKKPKLTYKAVHTLISIGIVKAQAAGFYNGKNKVNCHTMKSIEEVK